jgi:hypothetical protein
MYVIHPLPQSPWNPRIMDNQAPPVPTDEVLDEIRANWEYETAHRPQLFNGKIFSLDRIEGSLLTGFLADYSWYLAQLRNPALFDALRVRSLAVSGLVVAGGHVIFGKRKAGLAVEGGLWELAPSGTIHGGSREADGSISWRKIFQEEIREELGIAPPPTILKAFALIENTQTHIWEMGVALELTMDHRNILTAYVSAEHPEHTEMAAVPLEDVPRFLKVRREEMVGACPRLLAAYGLVPPP